MWLASTMPGLTASRSCQRRPLPRFCCVSFQRESPGFIVTTFNFAGAEGAMGAAGCEGVTRTAGGREGITSSGAEKKTFGRSKGERFTGGWQGAKRGGAGGETGGRSGITDGLGEASAGASANGRWNSADL